MAVDYAIFRTRNPDLTLNDDVVAAMKADGTSLEIVGRPKTVEYWGKYINNNSSWLLHARTEGPLSSLFGRNPYATCDVYHGEEGKRRYEEAKAALGVRPVTFRPKRQRKSRRGSDT